MWVNDAIFNFYSEEEKRNEGGGMRKEGGKKKRIMKKNKEDTVPGMLIRFTSRLAVWHGTRQDVSYEYRL